MTESRSAVVESRRRNTYRVLQVSTSGLVDSPEKVLADLRDDALLAVLAAAHHCE